MRCARSLVLSCLAAALASPTVLGQSPAGQPARPGPIAGATPRIATPAAPPAAAPSDATLLQLMRGITYPASNVVFAAQDGLAGVAPAAEPAISPNPLTSSYGGWDAVENAGLALAESARLLLVPGRVCSNGRPVPVRRADWVRFTAQLRDAGRAAYEAARSKNEDAMVEASGTLTDACSACHEVYRNKRGGSKDRCLP